MNIDIDKLDVTDEKDSAVLFGLGLPIEVWSESDRRWFLATSVNHLTSPWGDRKRRRKPIETPKRTITIPQCLTEEPESGTTVFFVCLSDFDGYVDTGWTGSAPEIAELKNGGVFATEEDAKAFVAAMRGVK